MNKTLQSLSLCKMAGKLAEGFDTVKSTVLNGKAELLAVSYALSEKTKKEVKYLADSYELPMIVIDADLNELWYQLNRRTGVFAITDSAMAKNLINAAQSRNEEDKE